MQKNLETKDLPYSEIAKLSWYYGDLSYKLHKLQLDARNRFNVAVDNGVMVGVALCCRQFGKTYFATIMALEDAIRNPGSCVYIFAPEKKQGFGIIKEKINEIGVDAPPGFIRENKYDQEWYIGSEKNESVIRVHQLAGQGKESKRGFKGLSLYFEETRDIPSNDYGRVLGTIVPLITHSVRPKIFHCTTMPYDPNHSFMRTTYKDAENDGVLFSYTIDDMPTDLVSEEMKRSLIHVIGQGQGRFSPQVRRELYNEPAIDRPRCAVPGFTRDKNIKTIEVDTDQLGFLTVGDMGYKNNMSKTIFVIVGYDPSQNKMYVFDEVTFPVDATDDKIVKGVRSMEKAYISGKPTRILDTDERTRRELARLGFNFHPANKKDKEGSLKDIDKAFVASLIEVHKKCILTANTLEYGEVNSRNQHKFHDVYGHNDAIDVIKYAWRGREQAAKNVDGLNTGELFHHPNGDYNKGFIGVVWQSGHVPSYFCAFGQDGGLLKVWAHRGFAKDRIEHFIKFSECFKQCFIIQATENASSKFLESFEGEIKGIQSIKVAGKRHDLFNYMRDRLNDGDISISRYLRLEREINDSDSGSSDEFPLVDACIMANHILGEYLSREERLNKGGIIRSDCIQKLDQLPQKSKKALAIYYEKKNYTYLIKTHSKHASVFLENGSYTNLREILEKIDLDDFKSIACSENIEKELETELYESCIDIEVTSFDVDKLSPKEILSSFIDEQEFYIGSMSDHQIYFDSAVLYPDEDSHLIKANKLIHLASNYSSISNILCEI